MDLVGDSGIAPEPNEDSLMSIEFRSQVNQAFSGLLGSILGRGGMDSQVCTFGEKGSDFPQR